jgi:hypothetical protein
VALLPNATQIPSQRVQLNEGSIQKPLSARDGGPGGPVEPVQVSREWYRFFDLLHTYTPTPAAFIPTFTTVTNVASLTAGTCFYNQMGTTISLTGSFVLTPTATGDTVFRMTPPVLNKLAPNVAAGMFITTAAGVSDVGSITLASNLLEFRVNVTTLVGATYVFNVNYQIA